MSVTSVAVANEIFSNISVSAENDEINQCVMEVNQTADDDLDTATRLYQTGICYFCIDCNFAVDNGKLFLVSEAENPFAEPSSIKNYKTAHKLIAQSAGLGNYEAYYGLAILLYISELTEIRQAEDVILKSKAALVSKTKNENEKSEKNEQESSDNIFTEIIDKSYKSQFSQQIQQYLLLAAKKGYLPAQFALSEVYSKGIGVDKDSVQAYAWVATAVAQNPPFGSARRDEKAAVLDNVKLNQAEAIAEEYMKRYTDIFERASVTVMR